MVLATLAFTVMIGLVKVARADLGTFEVVFWRNLAALPVTWLLAARMGGLAIRNKRALGLRIVAGFCAMCCYFTAAKGLALADLMIIGKLQPVFVAMLAPLALGMAERAGKWVWIAVAFGLGGSALVVGPDLAVGSQWGLWALGATLFSAIAHVTVRLLGRTERPLAIVCWFQLGALALSLVGYSITSGNIIPIPPLRLLPHLVGAAFAATVGQLLMTRAYAEDRAALVAGASYAAPLSGVLADLAVFSTVPTLEVIAGGALIIAAGLLLMRSKPVESPAPEAVDSGSTAPVPDDSGSTESGNEKGDAHSRADDARSQRA